MKILILAAKENGNRHIRWIDPLESIGGVSSTLVLKFRSYGVFFFRSLWTLRRFNPDIIICMGADLIGFIGTLLSKLLLKSSPILSFGGDPIGVRQTVLSDNNGRPLKKLKYYIFHHFNLYVYKNCPYFLVNSHYLRNQLLRNDNHFKNKNIFVIPQALQTMSNSEEQALGDNNPIHLITVTNLEYRAKYYGALELLEFLQRYTQETGFNSRIVFTICGCGIYASDLRKKLEHPFGKHEKLSVCYLGFVDNLEPIYKAAHAFLYSSSLDSLPRVLLEAQAHGLPILVNDFEPFREIIKDGYNGLLYKSGDFADFRTKLDMLIADQNLAHSLIKNARKHLKRNHSVKAIGKRLEEILLKILTEKKRPEGELQPGSSFLC
jgi:glycosyltransferase involved in cell wall biosynthesis